MSLINPFKWRYATKKFSNKKIDETLVNEILEIVRLSPSSYGVQPYKILIIKDEILRKQIREASFDQSQVTDASHLIIFTAKTKIDTSTISELMDITAVQRNVPRDSLKQREEYIAGSLLKKSQEVLTEWAKKQAYIALGVLSAATAELNIDMCPMEGFEANKVDQILNLQSKGLATTLLAPIGYRSEDDDYAKLIKVRKPKEIFYEII